MLDVVACRFSVLDVSQLFCLNHRRQSPPLRGCGLSPPWPPRCCRRSPLLSPRYKCCSCPLQWPSHAATVQEMAYSATCRLPWFPACCKLSCAMDLGSATLEAWTPGSSTLGARVCYLGIGCRTRLALLPWEASSATLGGGLCYIGHPMLVLPRGRRRHTRTQWTHRVFSQHRICAFLFSYQITNMLQAFLKGNMHARSSLIPA
jgi:hypothetical protein